KQNEQQRTRKEAAHLGFDDISGQLDAALDQYDGVSFVPFSWVAALIVAYILIIGPGDYFFLRKVVGRMELTWITSTLTVVVFSAIAWALVGWPRGDRTQIAGVDLVDVDVATGQVRGTHWRRVYSPRNQRFNLAMQSTFGEPLAQPPAGMLLAWHGLPGKSISGMDAASRAGAVGRDYAIVADSDVDQTRIESLPIAVGGSKGLLARSWSECRLTGPSLEYTPQRQIRGVVENPFDVRLANCVLYHDRWAYPLETLEPGQTVAIDDRTHVLDVAWMLTERAPIEGRNVALAWDHERRDDPGRIMRMMMFHQAAGGRLHTNLLHRYFAYVDLSQHLPLERAILVGEANQRAAQLSFGDAAEAAPTGRLHTYYRLVLPTRPRE
ncbi:MAG: hypothetical protein KDA41_10650, partial [Planctomycetales bacterium]|nr:hypothetical protein [Planctomycetales bacterium]